VLEQYVTNAVNNDKNVTVERFQPDTVMFRKDIKILVARLLIAELDHFKWMELVVPNHIQNSIANIIARPTASYYLPLLLKNETQYDDCIQIMDSYEEQLSFSSILTYK